MRKQYSSTSSTSASPLIYGNIWSRWSIIASWTLTIKISQVLVPGAARDRPGSNHCRFTLLMMGRELIYPGGKQIKALLIPALRLTIAYINILSWATQVSKGLVHLHLHKGLLSTLWPPLLSALLLMSAYCPLLHLPVFLLSFSLPPLHPPVVSFLLCTVELSSSTQTLSLAYSFQRSCPFVKMQKF